MKTTTLMISLVLGVLSTSAWAAPSRVQRAWRAAKAVVLHPKDSFNTLRSARRVLNRRVGLGEKISILAAHNTGVGRRDARGTLRWKPGVIAKKARILGSFKPAERSALIRSGVVGHGPWVMVLKRGDEQKPRWYHGVKYPNFRAALQAMERDKGERVQVMVNDTGYVVRP